MRLALAHDKVNLALCLDGWLYAPQAMLVVAMAHLVSNRRPFLSGLAAFGRRQRPAAGIARKVAGAIAAADSSEAEAMSPERAFERARSRRGLRLEGRHTARQRQAGSCDTGDRTSQGESDPGRIAA